MLPTSDPKSIEVGGKGCGNSSKWSILGFSEVKHEGEEGTDLRGQMAGTCPKESQDAGAEISQSILLTVEEENARRGIRPHVSI
jgi:hypothetical protein